MTRHLWRDLALHRLDLVVGVGAGLAPEDRRDAVERVARQFHRDEGVVDRRCLGIAGDGVDVGLMGGERGVEDRAEIGVVDAREIRQAEGTVPMGQRITVEIDGRLGHVGISGKRGERIPM